jgi:hypothetical protein
MKTIIAGSRNIESMDIVREAYLQSGIPVSEVVSGGCRGVDTLAEAMAHSVGIPVKRFPAAWSELGKAAGPVRNAEMAEYADALIAIWDGVSRGTRNMIRAARGRGLRVYIHHVP